MRGLGPLRHAVSTHGLASGEGQHLTRAGERLALNRLTPRQHVGALVRIAGGSASVLQQRGAFGEKRDPVLPRLGLVQPKLSSGSGSSRLMAKHAHGVRLLARDQGQSVGKQRAARLVSCAVLGDGCGFLGSDLGFVVVGQCQGLSL